MLEEPDIAYIEKKKFEKSKKKNLKKEKDKKLKNFYEN